VKNEFPNFRLLTSSTMTDEPFTEDVAMLRGRKVVLVPTGGGGGTGPGVSGQWVTISTQTVTNVGQVNFLNLTSAYAKYEISFEYVRSSVGSVFALRCSSDNGVTFAGGAGSYISSGVAITTECQIGSIGALATEKASGTITMYNAIPTGNRFLLKSDLISAPGGAMTFTQRGHQRNATVVVNCVALFFTAGLIAEGTFRLRGQLA
jgi:hypothetical protein